MSGKKISDTTFVVTVTEHVIMLIICLVETRATGTEYVANMSMETYTPSRCTHI